MRYLLLLIALLSIGATFGDIRSGDKVPTISGSPATGSCATFDANDNLEGTSCPTGALEAGDIDTYSELNTIVADVTLTHNGLIDTFSELDTIVADQTLVHSNSNIATATALFANGANCNAGEYPLGVDASGAVESCTDATTEIDSAILTHTGDDDAHHALVTLAGTPDYITIVGQTITRGTVDVSDDTNLAVGGTLLNLTGDTLSVNEGTLTDTKYCTYASGSGIVCNSDADSLTGATFIKSAILYNPTTAESGLVQLYFPHAVTITEVVCSTDTGTATIQFDERAEATPNSGGTDVLTSALVCDSDSQSTTGFDNAGIAADVPLNLDIDAVASTPTKLRIHVYYDKD